MFRTKNNPDTNTKPLQRNKKKISSYYCRNNVNILVSSKTPIKRQNKWVCHRLK